MNITRLVKTSNEGIARLLSELLPFHLNSNSKIRFLYITAESYNLIQSFNQSYNLIGHCGFLFMQYQLLCSLIRPQQ